MMSHLEQAYEFDIRLRLYDDRTAPDGIVIFAEDISEGVVYDKGGVKITAFEVDHTPVKPAFGYRIDYAGHSVVLSGDTRVSANLIRYAQGKAGARLRRQWDVLCGAWGEPNTCPEGAVKVFLRFVRSPLRDLGSGMTHGC